MKITITKLVLVTNMFVLNHLYLSNAFAETMAVETLHPTHKLEVRCENIVSQFNLESKNSPRKVSILVESKVSLKSDGTVALPYIRGDQSARVVEIESEKALLELNSESLIQIHGVGIRPIKELLNQIGFSSAGLIGIYHGWDFLGKSKLLQISIGQYFMIPNSDSSNGFDQLSGVLNIRMDLTNGFNSGNFASVIMTSKKMILQNGFTTTIHRNQIISNDAFNGNCQFKLVSLTN